MSAETPATAAAPQQQVAKKHVPQQPVAKPELPLRAKGTSPGSTSHKLSEETKKNLKEQLDRAVNTVTGESKRKPNNNEADGPKKQRKGKPVEPEQVQPKEPEDAVKPDGPSNTSQASVPKPKAKGKAKASPKAKGKAKASPKKKATGKAKASPKKAKGAPKAKAKAASQKVVPKAAAKKSAGKPQPKEVGLLVK